MPRAPLRPCAEPGCPALVVSGRCEPHAKHHQRRTDARRGSAHERGYDYRWRQYSRAFIRRHPLCAICAAEGRTTATECVDHIVPHKGDESLFWDRNNHQPACITCNSRKAALQEGGFGRGA